MFSFNMKSATCAHFILTLLLFAKSIRQSGCIVSSRIAQQLKTEATLDIFVIPKFSTQSILSQISSSQLLRSRKGEAIDVINFLKAQAAVVNHPIMSHVSMSNKSLNALQIKPFWITNKILIKGVNANIINNLAARSDVAEIREVRRLEVTFTSDTGPPFHKQNKTQLEWGLKMIDVEKVWAAGINGSGVRVGVIDTGVRYTHEALRNSMAKDYHWYDIVEGTVEPIDRHGHGTHVTGIVTGGNGIGVAPGAEWAHCRCLDEYGFATEDMFLACAEWFTCPTKPDGSDPDCSKAPHIISNSWGLLDGGLDFMDDVIAVWLKLGIVPVFGIGNEGETCGRGRSPGDTSLPIISVGATDCNDAPANFSSTGPSFRGQIKPDIAAPGAQVVSAHAFSDTEYLWWSGTSMATPHVSGVVALLISSNPNITVEEIRTRLFQGATHSVKHSGRNCGGIPESVYPNNHVGWGRLSAPNSVLVG